MLFDLGGYYAARALPATGLDSELVFASPRVQLMIRTALSSQAIQHQVQARRKTSLTSQTSPPAHPIRSNQPPAGVATNHETGKREPRSLPSLTLGRIARNRIPAVLVFIGILILGLMLARHTRIPDPATFQRRTDDLIGLSGPAHSVGQTLAGKNHLSAIRLSLHTDLSGEQTSGVYSITLGLIELRNHTEVAKSVHRIPPQSQNFELEFAFTPQRNSKDTRYVLVMETDAPSDQVSLWAYEFRAYARALGWPNPHTRLTTQLLELAQRRSTEGYLNTWLSDLLKS